MKINAEIFLTKIEELNLINNAILISGNEAGLVSRVESLVIKKINQKEKADLFFFDFKGKKEINFDNMGTSQSLFNNYTIINLKSSSDLLIEKLEGQKLEEKSIVVSGENIRINSKLQKYFERHKNFISVVCYKLTKIFKKNLIDNYIRQKKFMLSNEAYDFLLNYLSDDYLIIENELEKIANFSKKEIKLSEIKKLISGLKNMQIDELFLGSILSNNKSIIKNSEKSIESINDAYALLNIVKNYSKILTKTSEEKSDQTIESLCANYLPKYLFKQKNNFEAIIERSSINKIITINELVQKTELLLRKNDSNFLIIIQRFLLNCAKTLK